MYPNGDESCTGKHLSLFMFIVRQNPTDETPRTHRIIVTVVDQSGNSAHINREYQYNSCIKTEKSCSIQPGINENNIGSSKFLQLKSLLIGTKYVVKDRIIFKFSIEE